MPDDETNPNDPATGEARFSRAKEFVGDKYSAAQEKVKATYSDVKEKVGAGYGKVKEKVDDIDFEAFAEQTRAYVRANPGKALLVSVGAGFIIGLLLRGRGRDEE
jgi:ElaB/YqjD/DUF883 family membrane-anchored ribosome-binding protein